MANPMKARMNELFLKESEKNPEILNGKKILLRILVTWIALRAILLTLELVCALSGFFPFPTLNLLILVVGVLFALSIYAGAKLFAFLPILGGFLSLTQAFNAGYHLIVASSDYYTIIRIYAAAYILVSIIQIILFITVLTNKKTRLYCDTLSAARKTAMNENKPL